MGAAREPDQADFDLERFIDMFDTAMTSSDPRVIETLRKLLMIVALTRPETRPEHDRRYGPLRRMFEDLRDLNQHMGRLDDEIRNIANAVKRGSEPYRWNEEKYTMQAASMMAKDIDAQVMSQISTGLARQINGGLVPKGKLK